VKHRTVGAKEETDPRGWSLKQVGLQKAYVRMRKALGLNWPVRGVFRFRTHEEADEWMATLEERAIAKARAAKVIRPFSGKHS